MILNDDIDNSLIIKIVTVIIMITNNTEHFS